jgi:hypothetical protein
MKDENGQIISLPIDNLYPYISEDEYIGNNYFEWVKLK